MAKEYCIICGKAKAGIPVREDYVIDTMRWFKRNITHNEQGNALDVCKACYPDYKKLRSRFVNRQRLYMGIGLLFLIFVVLISFQISTFAVALLFLGLLYLVSLANYMPDIAIKKAK
ncbi:MAG: hypothetical protein KGH72_01765 [Candidatus Micrarchaeota archaeon]|nr:hypothetical protein [Candidatus Micrarchaeota archaeon]